MTKDLYKTKKLGLLGKHISIWSENQKLTNFPNF